MDTVEGVGALGGPKVRRTAKELRAPNELVVQLPLISNLV
jgi:hypothetical protein